MSDYQIFNTITTVLAIIVSFIALIRTREFSKKQLELTERQETLSALTALVSGYTEQAKLFEKIIEDGTADEFNLDVHNIEVMIEEYYTKRHLSIEKIEKILNS